MLHIVRNPLKIAEDLKAYVRRFDGFSAKVDEPTDQQFFPLGYLRIPYAFEGKPAISIPDKGVFNEVVKPGPYFSGIIEGDNAYMHFFEDVKWTLMELKAGMAYYLFHVDMTHRVNTTKHILEVTPLASDFNQEALAAQSLEEVASAYERFLRQCIPNRKPPILYIDAAVQLIEETNGAISIVDLFEKINIPVSPRQFIRNFKKVIGTSPKRWCRIQQISYASALIEGSTDLTSVAIEAGFFDQAHFTRAFHQFIHQNPSDFIQGEETEIAKFLFRRTEI